MKFSKIFLVILFSVSQIFAQDIGVTEVRVVEGFRPTIPEASRLNEKASFADTIKKERTQEYDVLETDLNSNYKTRPLNPAKVKADKISKLYSTKVLVGFGNAWSTEANVVHNSTRSKNLSYGLLMNHFANKYDLYKNSKNIMHLYGKKINNSHIFLVNLDYERRTALFFPENPVFPDEENYRNRFSYTKLSLSSVSKELAADKLKHYTTFFVSDFNEFSENQIHLSTDLSKTINGLPFSLQIELDDYLNYNNPDSKFESINVQSFHFSPSASYSKYGLDFDFGLEFHYLSDGKSFDVFPQIKVAKELVNGILLVHGGFRHIEQRHTLKSLSDENPYIHSYGFNQAILSENSILQILKMTDTEELYIAMRNVLSIGEVLEGSIAYGTVQNFNHFVNYDNSSYNRFLVDYIFVKQLQANLNYTRKINEIIDLKANARYCNWDTEVYHNPNFTFDISAPINLRNKIKVAPLLSYISKRKTSSSFDSDSGLLVSKINQSLASQFHMNLAIDYNYTKNISAFLHLNNLTNSKKNMWNGYLEVGFNGIFGINYSF